ncbi:MAG: family 1 glycosylhydrolase [Bacteroidota bacterium]
MEYHEPNVYASNGWITGFFPPFKKKPELRQKAIVDYAQILHQALQDGIDIRGYFWWSTWDNFEWHLVPAMKFGLYECDVLTKERRMRKSAEVFRKLEHYKMLDKV